MQRNFRIRIFPNSDTKIVYRLSLQRNIALHRLCSLSFCDSMKAIRPEDPLSGDEGNLGRQFRPNPLKTKPDPLARGSHGLPNGLPDDNLPVGGGDAAEIIKIDFMIRPGRLKSLLRQVFAIKSRQYS